MTKRNITFDILRIIAAFAVIMVHASAYFVAFDGGTTEFTVGNLFDSISRIGTLFFIMISGSLMLDEDKDFQVKKLICKNIKTLLLLIFFWSAVYSIIYEIIYPTIDNEEISFFYVFYAILFPRGHYHMWYLYMIIGLYMATPFLRTFIKKENKDLVLFFMAICLLTQFTPACLDALANIWSPAAYLADLIPKFSFDFFSGYIAYYVGGWYLTHIGITRKKLFYFAGALSILITFVFTQFTQDFSNTYSENNLLIFTYAAALFLLLNQVLDSHPHEDSKLIRTLTQLSFGVYVIHPIFLDIIQRTFPYQNKPLLYLFLSWGGCLLASLFSCYVLSKIPLLKKCLKM